jgi:ABC-type glycerol-3-phosphate transport system substrate-binding protein
MKFDVHGKYELEVRGEIFILRFYQNLNEECARDFFAAYKSFVLEKKIKQFGVLADFRAFEGATPEALRYIGKIFPWAMAQGQIAMAQIIDSILKEYMVNQPSQGQDLFPIQTFKDESSALVWIENQGLAIK